MTAREMQRRSAKVRWAKTARKPKRAARLPNADFRNAVTGAPDCKQDAQ